MSNLNIDAAVTFSLTVPLTSTLLDFDGILFYFNSDFYKDLTLSCTVAGLIKNYKIKIKISYIYIGSTVAVDVMSSSAVFITLSKATPH